jgi:thioester reductase-like protein
MLLVTGFPGFIAGRLVEEVLGRNEDEQAVALVEPRMRAQADELAGNITGRLGDADRIRVVEGDITAGGLGLEEDLAAELLAGTTRCLHLAAIYDLSAPLDICDRVNVGGTGNVLDFLESCKQPVRLGYFSTVQVAGDRTGRIYENELQLGQGFKNHYESTKHRAEVWVRQRMDRIPTTIFRPTIVVGDSRTGEIPKFDGPYFALELIRFLRSHNLPVSYVGPGKARFNLVPIDWAAKAAAHIFDQEEAVGLTCQLAEPEPLAGRELTELLCKLWDDSSPRGQAPAWVADLVWRIPAVQRMTGVPHDAVRYFNHSTSYDDRNTRRFTEPAGIRCPGFRDYAPVVVEYFRAKREGISAPAVATAAVNQDGAGRKRAAKAVARER